MRDLAGRAPIVYDRTGEGPALVLEGQTHDVVPEVVAPVLTNVFLGRPPA